MGKQNFKGELKMNNKELEMLKITNGKRKTRTLTVEEIENEVAAEIEELLNGGLLKKNIKHVVVYNECFVANSYQASAAHTAYTAKLTAKGTIKSIEIARK